MQGSDTVVLQELSLYTRSGPNSQFLTAPSIAILSFSKATLDSVQSEFCKLYELVESFDALENSQEYQDLRNQVGSFSITLTSCPFLASSNPTHKLIFLDPTTLQKEINKLYPLALESVLFEMCNLGQADKFESLIGRASLLMPNEFVEEYERLEYQSALKTRQILRECLPAHIWKHCPMAIMHTAFRPHYLMQQTVSHSQKIWERHRNLFDQQSHYSGDWKPVPEDERLCVTALITCRAGTEDSDPNISAQAEKDYQILKKRILVGNPERHEFYDRLATRLSMIEAAFSEGIKGFPRG